MNYSTAIFLISDKARAVMCTYEAETENGPAASQTMFKTLDAAIKPGDFVLVPTNTRHGMTVVKVKRVDVDVDFDSDADVEWIIGTIDRADFEALERQENDAIGKIKSAEKRKRKEELAEALFADAEEIKSLPIYHREGDSPAPPPPPPTKND